MVHARRLFPSLFLLVLLLAAYGCEAQRIPRIGPIVKLIKKLGLKKRIVALEGAIVKFFRGVKKPKPDPAAMRMCTTQSKTYKGLCFNPANCATVCRTEGFKGGKCAGVRRRCVCTKKCF